MKQFFSITLIVTSLIAAAACSHTVNVYQYKFDSTLDEVFVKKGVDFKKYRSVMIDRVSVWYPTELRPSEQNIERARANLSQAQALFQETLTGALSDRYQVVEKIGKNVLRVQVEFIDLRAIPAGGKPPEELKRYTFRTEPGHITMVARLLDSESGEMLARASDQGKRASYGGEAEVDWDAIASDFSYWATVFRGWLDQVNS